VLLVAVEAPSCWLGIRQGAKGEAAALFGDGAGACLVTASSVPGAWPIRDVVLGCDGSAGDLVGLYLDHDGPFLEMDGPALAARAVQCLTAVMCEVCARHGMKPGDLADVFIHAGNGRLPALVARQLGIASERVHSTTAWTGNLGSVSLLAALAHQPPRLPAVCAAVGAGLCWGAVLLGSFDSS
jgi:3-oxoacyl-[acyl-carrier-protein] synthase-3